MIKAVSLSKVGHRSTNNQDAFLALPSVGVFAVADGVGGRHMGERASRLIVDTLYRDLQSHDIQGDDIDKAIQKANRLVYEEALGNHNSKGMASTLALIRFTSEYCYCYNIGDSRIYRIRDQDIQQLTRDHVKQVERPEGTKSMITQAIGLNTNVLPDITEWDWLTKDLFILLTDGISDQLSDDTLHSIISDHKHSMTDRVRSLIEASEQQGGRDDKTVILIANES